MFCLVYSQILRTFIHRQLLGIILAQLQNVDVTVAIFLKTNPQWLPVKKKLVHVTIFLFMHVFIKRLNCDVEPKQKTWSSAKCVITTIGYPIGVSLTKKLRTNFFVKGQI